MEENNRKGPGIFYAVVGVATLVVAIVGATFAFFTATADDVDDVIKGQTTTAASVSLAVEQVSPASENLKADSGRMVPLLESVGIQTALTKGCVDANGYVACQVYKITVTNGSASEAVLSTTSLKLDATNVTDLRWQVLSDATTLADDSSAVSTHTTASDVAAKETINVGTPAVYYVAVWMHDSGSEQNAQAGKGFTGTVSANVVNADGSAATQVTAQFAS